MVFPAAAAAAAESLQSCPTLCDPTDGSPGKNTGVGCHFLLQRMKVKSKSEVAQSCPTLSNPMDCSLPGSSVHGIFQARVLEWGATAFSSGFPYFLQFKSEFGSKEFMIWATVSSRSCFCWLYRASPSLAAKNIINLISVLTFWWCPLVESSLVLLEEGVCSDQCVLLAKLSLCPVSFCTPRPNLPVTPGSSWLPTFAFQSPIMKRTFFSVLVLEGLVGLHRTVQLQLLQHYWLGHTLGLLWYWMVCLGNEERSFCHF